VVDPQNPATLLYADFCEGVFKSTDGGTSWSAVNSGLPTFPNSSNVSVNALAIDPRNSNTYYAATYIGVFKSTDGGSSWSLANSGLRATQIAALAVDPQNSGTVYASLNDFSAPGALFKSTDGAANWTTINAGLRAIAVGNLTFDPEEATLYGTALGEVIKSTDGGTSWNQVHSGYLLAIDPKNSATLYATNAGAVVKSTDRGANWNLANTGLPEGCIYLSSLSIDPQDTSTIYAGFQEGGDYCPRSGNGGVWKTTDGATGWVRVGSTPSGGGVHGIAVDPTNSSTVYAGNGKGLFKSTNAGTNWSAVNSGTVYALAIDPQGSSTLYASVGGSGVFKSTDAGESWSSVNSGLPAETIFVMNSAPFYPVSILVIDPRNTSTVYAGTHSGVFKSTDGGASWGAVNAGLTTLSVGSLAIDPNNTNTVYTGTAGGVFTITFTAE
jgi:photosystem II stability/assembly factor-like uncharacterized protein